jgi:hypothetical protein
MEGELPYIAALVLTAAGSFALGWWTRGPASGKRPPV